jgi:hypothetical protein
MPATEVLGFADLCHALSLLDVPEALSVLDSSTGEFLEHRQLRRDPRYKATWSQCPMDPMVAWETKEGEE